tara:strand:- start:115 stop:603 length:489 start_codon:yes stop_codon:yes gene_type:complete
MKIKAKTVTALIVGIGFFIGTIGVASASPHYSDWNGTRLIEKPSQAVRIDHPTIKRSADFHTPSFKKTMTVIHGEEASAIDQASKNAVSVTPRPQLPDGTVCLTNVKVWALQNTGTSLHDSVHCLHGGERKEQDRTSSFFSMGLHNDGTFLPLHRSFFMAVR